MVIWFNHWFSTAYHIVNLMREGYPEPLHVIGSNRLSDSVMLLACDEKYTEPDKISDSEYLSYCLDFCKEHNVSVFVPRRGMGIISENKALFDEIGVKLLLDCGEWTGVFRNKLMTYQRLENIISENIPEYYEITGPADFQRGYAAITAGGERACIKLADDEGAVSFRVIDEAFENSSSLYTPPGLKIGLARAEQIIAAHNFDRKIIMMPYLKGEEVSADCLAEEGGNIIIPRFKGASRIYRIKYEPEIISCCERILNECKLQMPCNIQFKYDGGKPYLLEINTRMSGGVQLSCMGAGVNIPAAALCKLTGKPVPTAKTDICERKVSFIETPVVI